MNRNIQRTFASLPRAIPSGLEPALLGLALVGASGTAGATDPNAGWHADKPPAKACFERIRVHAKVADSDNDAVVKIQSNEPSNTSVNHVIVEPLGNSGWHTHPGPSVVAVKGGIATVYEIEDTNCVQRSYPAGTGLIEGRRQARQPGQQRKHNRNARGLCFPDHPDWTRPGDLRNRFRTLPRAQILVGGAATEGQGLDRSATQCLFLEG